MSIRYTEDQITEGVLTHGPSIISKTLADLDSIQKYISRINKERLDYPLPLLDLDIESWAIPSDYKIIDIEKFLLDQCPKENYDRLAQELELYRKNKMIPVLQAMKYIVDTLRKNNILWGVGRGSSVASYVLFLLGVHKIDSVKYKLPIEEFFKGEQHG